MLHIHSITQYPAKIIARLLGLDDQNQHTSKIDHEGDKTEASSQQDRGLSMVPPVPPQCLELGRILITPTRIAVIGVEVEVSNRVVRYFVNHEGFNTEDFIRVSFGDEDSKKFFGHDLSSDICKRIMELCLCGIEICGRSYDFLAYSSSQLKDKSIWMVSCPGESWWTVGRIRNWMGDFSDIKTPSRYAARLGQCFSATADAVPGATGRNKTDPNAVRIVDFFPDVVTGQGNKKITRRGRHQSTNHTEWIHSDGTGLICKKALLLALKNTPFCPRNPHDVSIIQVRLGGAKGTLTGWDLDDLQRYPLFQQNQLGKSTKDIYLRPSMVKFIGKPFCPEYPCL